MPGKGKPFAKGQSGNPAGRPGVKQSVRQMAMDRVEAAFEALDRCMEKGTTAAQSMAAREVLDRAVGKSVATQHVRIVRSLSDLTDEELLAIASDPTGDEQAQEALH